MIVSEKVGRHCTIVDLIKQRKQKLFGYISRMNDEQLVKTVMVSK